MVQVGAPSREHLQRYQALMTRSRDVRRREINAKFRTDGWLPVIYRPQHHQPDDDRARCTAPPTCAWCRRCTTA